MKRFIEGESRAQSTLFPERLDDWITDDNPVRAVDVFVDELDFAALGFLEALQSNPASVANATTRQLLENADIRDLIPVVESIRAANIWNCPTVTLVKNIADDAEWQRRLGLMPPAMVERYRKGMPQWHAHPEVTQQVYDFYLKIVHALHERGFTEVELQQRLRALRDSYHQGDAVGDAVEKCDS